jgi:hypothetical protein
MPGVGRNVSEHPLYDMPVTRPVTFINELRLDRAI